MTNLEKILKKKNIKQIDLARKLGVTRSRLNNWVRGKSFPNSLEIMKQISVILKVPIEELFFSEKNKKS